MNIVHLTLIMVCVMYIHGSVTTTMGTYVRTRVQVVIHVHVHCTCFKHV